MTDTKNNGATVTKDNFCTAMADMAMQREFRQGANNTEWHHHRTLMKPNEAPAPLMNRDTLYSFSVVDGGGDVVITLPETDGRYMSLHVFNHNHVTVAVFYGPGTYVIPIDQTTDYFLANVRIQLNANDPEDLKKANGYQDQLKLEFRNNYKPKPFKVKSWNMDEFNPILQHYIKEAKEKGTLHGMGTLLKPVTPEQANRGVAVATGLLPDEDAMYVTENHNMNGQKTLKVTYQVPELRLPDIGFYSITIYCSDQWLKTEKGSNVNSKTVELNADGKSFDIYFVAKDEFDSCDQKNKLLVPSDDFWTCFRVFIPGKSVLDGGFETPKF